jgi:nitrilase
MTSTREVRANLAEAERLLAEAAARGAELAVLPENFSFMGATEAERRAAVERDGDGPAQAFLTEAAERHRLWVVGGTIHIRDAGADRAAARSLLIGPDGREAARYDKIHLFDVDVPGSTESHRESAHTVPGRDPRIVETPLGKLGLAVCYDMRFPELFRVMSRQGADLFVVPSAFTVPTGKAHWESLLRSRAIENLAGLIAPAQWGVHPNGRETYGDSMIIDHWGKVLARMPEGTGCVVAEIDAAGRMDARARFPSLEHRVIYNT